jgi:hypothetical protein
MKLFIKSLWVNRRTGFYFRLKVTLEKQQGLGPPIHAVPALAARAPVIAHAMLAALVIVPVRVAASPIFMSTTCSEKSSLRTHELTKCKVFCLLFKRDSSFEKRGAMRFSDHVLPFFIRHDIIDLV